VQRALGHLQQTLGSRRVKARMATRLGEARRSDLAIIAGGPKRSSAGAIALPDDPESLAIARARLDGRDALIASGRDARGLVYALRELSDLAELSPDPVQALRSVPPVAERPRNAIRSCMRMFCSDVEDKPWFNDRAFWTSYLSMLIGQRFNRFGLTFGLGYDFAREIRDAYLHFSYPFLLTVPGYDVRATNLDDAERARNLETLRFVSDEAAACGLHFQLGLWTHAFEWTDSPEANHRIEGLTAASLGPYCRDALALLLKECPNIAGVTLRTHGESGVAEGSYEFWAMVFDGVARAGRRVEIDLHAKGIDQKMIDAALATGQPVVVSPKFWAEHMGLPYHQAWIRPTELPQRERGEGLFANSSGARSFLRYGYGDLLREDRRYGVLHRIWPGTQRLLLWGDPELACAYGRAASFCGSLGLELMEPLSFKGRKGSGQPGHRTGYADPSLATKYDFEKYSYTYRLWGRATYEPDLSPEVWRRSLRHDYGTAAGEVEGTLSGASRILPLLTTAHTPSAANNHFWPEMYVNMSVVDDAHPEPFTDTPSPKRFGAVSPLDPQLFSRVDDFAETLVSGGSDPRYSPAEVAAWLDGLATSASERLAHARAASPDPGGAVFRRFAIDAGIQVELGRFFAAKLRAAVLYALFERTSDPELLSAACERYRSAREAWTRIIQMTSGVYMDDVSYGIAWYQRGHWRDRLAAIDRDIGAMEARASGTAPATDGSPRDPRALIEAVLSPAVRAAVPFEHTVAPSFRRGQPVTIEVKSGDVDSVRLLYRHVNQAEAWQRVDMQAAAGRHTAAIPAAYTDSPFPLQYYFEWRRGSIAGLYPTLGPAWSSPPYLVTRPA
jgi:hypothetical protein